MCIIAKGRRGFLCQLSLPKTSSLCCQLQACRCLDLKRGRIPPGVLSLSLSLLIPNFEQTLEAEAAQLPSFHEGFCVFFDLWNLEQVFNGNCYISIKSWEFTILNIEELTEGLLRFGIFWTVPVLFLIAPCILCWWWLMSFLSQLQLEPLEWVFVYRLLYSLCTSESLGRTWLCGLGNSTA